LMPLACFQALCDQVESRLMPTTTVSARRSTGSFADLAVLLLAGRATSRAGTTSARRSCPSGRRASSPSRPES
jgi:hypothetical protein